ncbi:restriction endonuclease subunit S [Enterococcus faecium]|nr:restriction endonuclease subunit S [Enterococcus faecium]
MQEERTNVPKIRFKGYAEDWEERKVGDFLKESKIKGTDGSIAKKLTVKLWRKGVIAKEEIYSGSSATQYYIRKAGQFMYGKLDFLNQAFGIVPPELDGYESTLDSPAFDIGKNMNAIFLLEYISLVRFYKYQGTIANGSRKAKRIHVDTFLEMPLLVPSFKEQQKIGTFFKQLDDTIALHQRKLDLLKQTKKSYLQKMFPKKGEDKPEIRFAGFTEDWEQRKLGDVLTVSKEKNKSNSYSKEQILSVSREVGTVNQIEYQGRSFAGADISGYKIVYPGQLIYTKSPLKGAPYGIFQLVTEEGIVSPLYAVYNSTEQALASFIGLQLKSDNIATHYLSPLVSKGAKNTINITDEGALDGRVTYPTITEQQKIVAFFKQLENTITLHQRELDSLKEMKKSLLQKMFV